MFGHPVHLNYVRLGIGDNDRVSDTLENSRSARFALMQTARRNTSPVTSCSTPNSPGDLSVLIYGAEGVIEVEVPYAAAGVDRYEKPVKIKRFPLAKAVSSTGPTTCHASSYTARAGLPSASGWRLPGRGRYLSL